MENITSIGGSLIISSNPVLSDLAGLVRLNYSTISNLAIENCRLLSTCNVMSICTYLDKGGSAIISGNNLGCNSVEEIRAACLTTAVDEHHFNDIKHLNVYPNPFTSIVTFDLEMGRTKHVTLKIYDLFGREVNTILDNQILHGEQIVKWDASNAGGGMYSYKIQTGKNSLTGRLLHFK